MHLDLSLYILHPFTRCDHSLLDSNLSRFVFRILARWPSCYPFLCALGPKTSPSGGLIYLLSCFKKFVYTCLFSCDDVCFDFCNSGRETFMEYPFLRSLQCSACDECTSTRDASCLLQHGKLLVYPGLDTATPRPSQRDRHSIDRVLTVVSSWGSSTSVAQDSIVVSLLGLSAARQRLS
jgi:hypothetical protein